MSSNETAISRRDGRLAPGVCALLALLMIVLSWSAIQTKSPTMDEPLHSVGAFVRVFHRDFRINPEDPPLWNHWVMLGESSDALQLDFEDPHWKRTLEATEYQSSFCSRSLFQSSNDGVAFIRRGRTRMVFLAAILAAVLAWWSWRIAGPVGSITATMLLCLDPNFIAHAPLIKNDIAMTLVMLALAAAAWSVGRALSWWNILLPGIVLGIGLGTKFSAVLLGPMLVLMLLIRALLPGPWRCFGRDVRGMGVKFIEAAGVCAAAAIVSWLIVWGSYGFRFEPTNKPGARLPMQSQVEAMAQSRHFLAHGRWTTPEQARQIPPGALERSIVWLEKHRLMPQAWLYGLLFTYRTTLVRGAFLLGMHSDTGWWYYFPLAMLFKTPLATLAGFVIAVTVAINLMRRRSIVDSTHPSSDVGLDRWTITCLLVPMLIYGFSAMTSNLNLGLRHILPVYPFLYMLVAIAAERLRKVRMRTFRLVAVLLAGGLIVESFAAFPNYIPFFNAVFRPHRIKLLSDSNLDWGQDLPALSDWRRRHLTEKLYFGYFGTTDPAVYGIEYLNIPGGFWLGPPFTWPDTNSPGVLAISATLLQGVNTPPSLRYYYAPLRAIEPMAILGGSIYLYQLPLPAGIELRLPRS